jgi:anti-sigma B factor antagonist
MFQGEIDLACSNQTREAILGQLNGKNHVLVDLAGVEYIDSSGIASLVEGYQRARAMGLRFGLVAVSDAARKVLELARLDQVFPIHDSVEARIQADG